MDTKRKVLGSNGRCKEGILKKKRSREEEKKRGREEEINFSQLGTGFLFFRSFPIFQFFFFWYHLYTHMMCDDNQAFFREKGVMKEGKWNSSKKTGEKRLFFLFFA